MDPFLGEIRPVPYNFAPLGWAFCQGQILPISQNTALFALLGTTYGGNGTTTFALPDLRGRIPVNKGQAPGLSNIQLGEQAGVEDLTLLTSQLPAHSHVGHVSNVAATSFSPNNEFAAITVRNAYGPPGTANLAADTVTPSGGSQAHNNLQPYTVINYIIALQGIFPPRT